MATQSITGKYGDSGGTLSGSVGTSIGYNTGWTNVPIGSRIWSFPVSFSASCSGSGGLACCYRAYAWGGWPAETTNYNEDGWNSGSASAGANAGTPAAGFIKFFEGNPGDIGGGEVATTESFYSSTYSLDASNSGTLTFDPPPSKTLFFGAVG